MQALAMSISERYSSAINSKNLAVDERTSRSDSDVLGAFGIASRRLSTGWVTTGKDGEGYDIKQCDLAVPLTRFFAGDGKAAHAIIETLSQMVWSKADNDRTRPKLTRPAAHDMACACFAWHRDGVCKKCGGTGYSLVHGTGKDGTRGVLSERDCEACHGTRKVPLEREFIPEHREVARWLIVEMERAMGRAAPMAMQAISERMEL